MKKLILMTLLASSLSLADVDKFAHLGGGYICQDIGFRLTRRIMRLDTTDANIYAGFGCGFIGLVKEMADKRFDGGDLAAQAAGQMISIVIHIGD